MFKKILILEDIDCISIGVNALLIENFSFEIQTAKYCDDAYLKIKKAIIDNTPFDLIITDLSFKNDPGRDTQIATGEALIKRMRDEDIHTKIIVYSVEDKPYLIRSLFSKNAVSGFVVKGRESSNELVEAVIETAKGGIYISPEFASVLNQQSLFEIDMYDVEILKLLSEGFAQDDISRIFKQKEYPSPSTSSIEKKINRLKYALKANNSIHLVAIAKNMRIV